MATARLTHTESNSHRDRRGSVLVGQKLHQQFIIPNEEHMHRAGKNQLFKLYLRSQI